MNQTENLLQTIIENARMGQDACDQLLARAQDEAVRQELMNQKQQYAAAAQAAEQKLTSMGVYPQPKGPMARMGLWMGVQMNTMADRTAAHIADITIQGCNMGVLELTKALNSLPEADSEAQGIAQGLMTVQQEAIEKLKPFLVQKEAAAQR